MSMPSYLRPRIPGASIFFTVALADRRSRLLIEECAALRTAVRLTREARPFRIDAWVVLPEHMHCIWTLPEGDADYSGRWKEIKTRFTKSVGLVGRRSASQIAKGEAGLWQRRFWDHHIRHERDYLTHLQYCWWNPVHHGLVDRARDWPYSSIHRDIRLGRCAPDWTGVEIKGDFGE
jgi:putative transposase